LKEKSREATRVLVVIVFIFLICNFWGFVLALLEQLFGVAYLTQNYKTFYAFSREAINFLAIVNSSINFVIYCIFGKDFRKELVIVYGCGCASSFALHMPVQDKFAAWRHKSRRFNGAIRNGRRRKSNESDSNDTTPRHKTPISNSNSGQTTPNIANIGMQQFSKFLVARTGEGVFYILFVANVKFNSFVI
jgi:hypothetical protein